MVYAVRKTEPDGIIHLGDCWSDAVRLQRRFPEIPMEQVPGNCDCSMEVCERILLMEGFRILICHGHTLQVKSSYLPLQLSAQERKVDIALFGHTHKVFYDRHNGVAYLNPGSIGAPGFGIPPSYGILTLDQETGRLDMDVFYIE